MSVVSLRVAGLLVMGLGAAGAFAADAGKAEYDSACAMCHNTGMAGAPKLGDKAAWKDRLSQGEAVLVEHSIKGFKGKTGMMPAKGGNPENKDADITAAVKYMMEKSK